MSLVRVNQIFIVVLVLLVRDILLISLLVIRDVSSVYSYIDIETTIAVYQIFIAVSMLQIVSVEVHLVFIIVLSRIFIKVYQSFRVALMLLTTSLLDFVISTISFLIVRNILLISFFRDVSFFVDIEITIKIYQIFGVVLVLLTSALNKNNSKIPL